MAVSLLAILFPIGSNAAEAIKILFRLWVLQYRSGSFRGEFHNYIGRHNPTGFQSLLDSHS
jgi:hypothetical protein